MSLDVYLYGDPTNEPCECERCGHGHTRADRTCLFARNITHNLAKMANEAGVYGALWRPDELGLARARDLIAPLRAGLAELRGGPDEYRRFEPGNGWGDYPGLVAFVEAYLAACEEFPDATVQVSR